MRRLFATLIAATAVLALPALADARPRQDPEVRLAKILEGRVAGEPVNCLYLPRIRDTQIIPKTAIVYSAGSVLYVNRPKSGASQLHEDDVLVTNLHGHHLCSIDVVDLVDNTTWLPGGFVFLGDFVPYRKVAARD